MKCTQLIVVMGIPQKVVLAIVNILPFVYAPLVSQNRPNRYRFYFDDATRMLQLHPGLSPHGGINCHPKIGPKKALQAFIKLGLPCYDIENHHDTVDGSEINQS